MALSDKVKIFSKQTRARLKVHRKNPFVKCRVCKMELKEGDRHIAKPTSYSGSGYMRSDKTYYHEDCAIQVGILSPHNEN